MHRAAPLVTSLLLAATALAGCAGGAAPGASPIGPTGVASSPSALEQSSPVPRTPTPAPPPDSSAKPTTPRPTAAAERTTNPKSTVQTSPIPKMSASGAVGAKSGAYLAYADWDADRARYAATDVVLFFYASWCPKCRDTDASAKAGMPSGLTLVKIDYDNATSLRQEFGVTLQHTFVQVDASGAAVKKWVGTYDDNSVAWVKAQTV